MAATDNKSKKEKRIISEKEIVAGGKDSGVLERFLKEFFPFNEFKKVGFFTAQMKNDYYAQAMRICNYFGFTSVFEYGAKEFRGHITYAQGKRPEGEGFITIIPSIYE